MRIATALLLAALAPAAFAGRGDLPPWIRASIPAALPPAGEASAQVLLDERAVTVTNAGDITLRHRRVVKILTAAGREEAFLGVPFDDATKIRSMNGWSIDRNGTEYALRMRDAIETSLGEYELYTDAKMKSLKVPADIGSIVAFEYEQSERPYLLQTTWYFQENVPVLRARFQLTLPVGWSYDAKWINYAAAEPVTPGTWEVQSVPAIVDEPRRPSRIALSGRVGFNFLAPSAKPLEWSDVATWYLQLANPRSAPTPPLQAKVRELIKDAPDPIAPLARFAQRDVRYIAIEIGIGGYQPHAAGEIFANRYGDCKDKATLLRTMLKEVGIDAYYVLVHATRGATKPEFPTIGAFNHVISAIPVSAERAKKLHAVVEHPKLGKLLLFDPTSTLTPLGELPEYLQDSRGLLVTNDGGELIELPAHAPEVNLLRRTATLQLGSDGTLAGTVEEVRKGSMASNMRAELQARNSAERAHYMQSVLASQLAAVTAENIVVQNLDEPESELVIRYTIVAPEYAKRVADMMLVRPRVIGQKAEALIDPKRAYEYLTDGPSLQNDDVEIRLPAMVQLDELPPKVEIKTPLVQYASASTFENGVLRYKRRYSMNTFAVPREQFSELNSAWKQILGDERASAVFK